MGAAIWQPSRRLTPGHGSGQVLRIAGPRARVVAAPATTAPDRGADAGAGDDLPGGVSVAQREVDGFDAEDAFAASLDLILRDASS